MKRITTYDRQIYDYMGDRIRGDQIETQEEQIQQMHQQMFVMNWFLSAANEQLQVIKYAMVFIAMFLITLTALLIYAGTKLVVS